MERVKKWDIDAVCFKTAKIIKTNANIIGEPRITNDEGVVAYLKRKQLNMLKYTYVSIVSRILLKRNIVEVLSRTRKWLLIWPWGPNVVVFCQQFVMALSFPSRDICTIVMWAKQTKEIHVSSLIFPLARCRIIIDCKSQFWKFSMWSLITRKLIANVQMLFNSRSEN